MFINIGIFIHPRFVLHVNFENIVWQVAGTHYIMGRANGIPFSEMSDEKQNKVRVLKDFWWPFGGQDNRRRNESYCPQLYFAGDYRIYSCMITNAS
jgi:hypothetical protein